MPPEQQDKRITPARGDLAASHLKGQVDAARFVDGEKASVIVGRVSLRREPSAEAPQDTEILFGESVTVYERKSGWAWIQAEADHYVGYVREEALVAPFATDAVVTALMTPLLAAPDAKSGLRDMLPLNARVKAGEASGNSRKVDGGFIHAHALAPIITRDFVSIAERFLGVPYVWGGKSFAGLDCSGLVQASLNACGIASPRDSDMMEKALGQSVSLDKLQRGDLIFWPGHVGVMQDGARLLHANAHFMEVTSEKLADAVARNAKPVSAAKRL